MRRKCIALSVKFKRENRSKNNNLSYYFKKLEKIQKNFKEKEIVIAKTIPMNLITRKQEKKLIKRKNWFLEKNE